MSESVSVLLLPKWNSKSPYLQTLGVWCLREVPPVSSGSPKSDLISSRVHPSLTGQMSPVSPNFAHHDLNASEGMRKKPAAVMRRAGPKAFDTAPERHPAVAFLTICPPRQSRQ